MEYMKAMKAGKEVVVIGAEDENSAVFWRHNGRTMCFSRDLGIFEHPATDEEIVEHFLHMMKEGCNVIIRGAAC